VDIDSVGRVARLLRSAIDDAAAQPYPPAVPCDVEGVAPVAEAAHWLAAGPGELMVLRPPRPQELAETVSALAKIRTAAVHTRQRQRHRERVADLVADLRAACDDLAKLTTCPVCQRAAAQPDRAMKPRDNRTYRCDCEWCHTSWETRLCHCGNRYPVGDHLDRVFAQDLLATPCWVRARSHICPACGRCSKSDAPDVVAACQRCRSRPAWAQNNNGRWQTSVTASDGRTSQHQFSRRNPAQRPWSRSAVLNAATSGPVSHADAAPPASSRSA
jgi:hypothetical protein